MEPFLRAGDLVVVTPIAAECRAPRPGDILLYERKPGVLRLHRLSRVQRVSGAVFHLRVRGDAPGQPAEMIPADCVLGVLTSFEHQGRLHDARQPLRRWTGLWWPRLRNRLAFLKKQNSNAPQDDIRSLALAVVTDAVKVSLRGQGSHPATPEAPASHATANAHALTSLARRHGVLALCATELIRQVPGAEKTIRDSVRALALEGENSRGLIAEALQALTAAGILPLIVKGPALGALAYNNPSVRPYDDVDLLLQGADRERAAAVLEQRGWCDSRNSPPLARQHLLRTTEDLAFRHPCCEVGIDIVHPSGILQATMPHTSCCEFTVLDAPAYAPSTVEHFLYCAAHGGKHGWTRLIWLADLDRLSASFTDADWKTVLTLAQERRLTRLLALACSLAGTLLGMPYPSEALGRWQGTPWLAGKVHHCLKAQFTNARHVETWRWWRGLLDTARQRFHFLLTWLFQPTGADLRACLLPLWAHPLYHVLRPLRLLLRVAFRLGTPPLTWESEPRTQV